MMQAFGKMIVLSLLFIFLLVAQAMALNECTDMARDGLKAPHSEGSCAGNGSEKKGPDGKIISGLMQCKDDSGKIIAESRFDKGARQSVWFYDAEGYKLSFMLGADEKAHGAAKIFSPDESLLCELKFKNGKIEGQVREFYPSGKIHRRYSVKNDLKEGRFLEYAENGKPMLERTYAHGVDVMEKLFYPDGKLQEHSVRKPDRTSYTTKNYWPNGKLQSVASFEVKKKPLCTVTEAVRVGKAYKYAADGSLLEEANYDDIGRPDGLQIQVDEQKKRTESVYANGKLTAKKVYGTDGKPELSEEYHPDGSLKK